jgi:hypothetical protein
MTVASEAIAEVTRLHDFFEAWYDGETGRSIGEFRDALDDRFTIVVPGGTVVPRDEIIEAVAGGRGKHGIAIVVENFDVVDLGTIVLCRYDEVQTQSGEETRRLSTAVMAPDTDTPGGFRWIAVHETWVPSTGSRG